MSDQVREDGGPLVQVRLVGPTVFAGTPNFYANYAQVGLSPHDFVMHFSHYSMPVISEPPTESLVIPVTPEPVATVSIPLNLVRGLIRALEGAAENWEKTFQQPLPVEPVSRTPTGSQPEQQQEEVDQR